MMACQNKQCLTFAKIKRADREKVCSKTNMITFKRIERGKNISYILFKHSFIKQTTAVIQLSQINTIFKKLVHIYILHYKYAV